MGIHGVYEMGISHRASAIEATDRRVENQGDHMDSLFDLRLRS